MSTGPVLIVPDLHAIIPRADPRDPSDRDRQAYHDWITARVRDLIRRGNPAVIVRFPSGVVVGLRIDSSGDVREFAHLDPPGPDGEGAEQ